MVWPHSLIWEGNKATFLQQGGAYVIWPSPRDCSLNADIEIFCPRRRCKCWHQWEFLRPLNETAPYLAWHPTESYIACPRIQVQKLLSIWWLGAEKQQQDGDSSRLVLVVQVATSSTTGFLLGKCEGCVLIIPEAFDPPRIQDMTTTTTVELPL